MNSTVELPKLCPDAGKQHRWAVITVHGCGYNSGDHATDEALVLPRYVDRPTRGCVCDTCFQIWNETSGTRDAALVAAYTALAAWG
jgi:hypothetical protein